jgi:hypothetical protein
LLISGEKEISIQELKQNTVYNNWSNQEMQYVEQFWEFLESLPNE